MVLFPILLQFGDFPLAHTQDHLMKNKISIKFLKTLNVIISFVFLGGPVFLVNQVFGWTRCSGEQGFRVGHVFSWARFLDRSNFWVIQVTKSARFLIFFNQLYKKHPHESVSAF